VYFDFRTYFLVLRLALTDKPSARRLLAHCVILPLITLWALANAVCLQIDRLLFPGCRRVAIANPVFIIGNARSGTTLFHRLLCGDEQRFIYFRTWEILFPALVQKRALRGLFGAYRRLFPRSFDRLVAWEERQLTSLKQQHPIGINKAEEDEFLLMIPFASAVLTLLFPYLEELEELVTFDWRPAPIRKRIMQFYRECVSRQLAFHGGGRALLSKNPSFVMKIQSLAEEFPDAKFVYLIRNPFETIPSLLKLVRTIWEGLGIESDHVERTTRKLADGCLRDYRYAIETLSQLPDDRWAIVEYTDLVADPKASVEKVYDRLNLTVSPDFAQRLAAERTRQKRYQSSNVYSLAEFGLSEAELFEKLPGIIERFGFRPEDVPERETREVL
jgi:hypothetical protein